MCITYVRSVLRKINRRMITIKLRWFKRKFTLVKGKPLCYDSGMCVCVFIHVYMHVIFYLYDGTTIYIARDVYPLMI